ncbi:MAG: MFS transporter [Candidatus Zixiibacteriota bacterium]
MSRSKNIFRKEVIGWSLYDFANTIYSMNILSLYFKKWVVEDLGKDGLYYDISYSLSMLLAGLLMPALGTLSDHSDKKKLFLMLFTFSCCLAIGIVPIVPLSLFGFIIILFAVSNFFYEGGMVFYNSLMYSVSSGKEARFISGFGVALGYLGAIVGIIIVLPFVTGELFGTDIGFIAGWGRAGAFAPTAILFALFSIPIFLWVKERKELVKSGSAKFKRAYRDVIEAIKDSKKYPGVMRFLIADYFFEDAVATVILNIGIYSSIVLGFSDKDLSVFLIITPISAIVGSFLIGKISQSISLKRMMTFIIYGWIVALIFMMLLEDKALIYIVGSFIGILLGGLWTVSRPLLAEMVPKNELGRFFGLYSLSGRAAAVIGPPIWGLIVYLFTPGRSLGERAAGMFNLSDMSAEKLPYRLAVVSLIIMMLIGLTIFHKLPEKKDG